MKIISSLLLIILFASCASGKERIYIGSTPAHPVVRAFLGISMFDSIDFIRWKLIIQGEKYSLDCNFGIGKPNTNGFITGGKKIELNGGWRKEKNYYYFRNGDKTLKAFELNASLLHLLNDDNNLLVGNGGWSYTLNIEPAAKSDQFNIASKQTVLKDSMAFEGRTPCRDFSNLQLSPDCYKLKWYVIFYSDPKTHEPTTYNMSGTAYRRLGTKTATWKIIAGKDGRIIYRLNSDRENSSLYLLKLDENVLIFADKEGKLFVGDEDFSYTLNRRW